MSKASKKENVEMTTMLEGAMTFSKTENGLNMLDFMCTEFAEMTPFVGNFKVQGMHNGDVYITEKPKRIHNTPLFREDNCSLTLGRDGKYHFIFIMPEEQVDEMPDQLVRQALAIAQKVQRAILKRKGGKR